MVRLQHDERRARLVETGARLFATQGYDQLSMSAIAREAGTSKALLYHYFPSKRDLFVAALADGAEDLRRRVEPAAGCPPAEALHRSLDAYLAWIDEHRERYTALLQSASGHPEVRELVAGIRAATVERLLAAMAGAAGVPPTPALRAALAGWLWFMDGAILDALAHDDLPRAALHDLLAGALLGALRAAGGEPVARTLGG